MTSVLVNGACCKMLIDSGADDNLVDEVTFNRWRPKPSLQPARVKMYAYEGREPLRLLGQMNALIEAGGNNIRANIVVVGGSSGCVLGYDTARDLGLFLEDQFKRVQHGFHGQSGKTERPQC